MGTMRLGGLGIDPARNVIANGAASWSIEPKIMDLLVLLAAHPGEVLSREFLIDQVWKVEFGADESLTRAVSLLRKTFREAGYSGEVIETIPKRGYRMIPTPELRTPDPAAPATPVAAESLAHPASEIVREAPQRTLDAPPPRSVPAGSEDAFPGAHAVAPPSATAGRRRFMIWGGLAAALAAIVVAVVVVWPKGVRPDAKPDSQLIAFFGFTPASDDPAVNATAEAANDAMFAAIRSNWVGTVARTATRGVAEDHRLERAAELGARYAMGGDVRSDANGITLSIRLEDVRYRLTLWERSVTSSAQDVAYLPAQATSRARSAVWCIVKTREGLTRDTPELMSLIADRCEVGGGVNSNNASYVVSRMRAIVEADPGSAYNQAQLVNVLGMGVQFAPASAKAAWIAEAEAALQRAIDLNPNESNILLARICLGIGQNLPAAEWDALLLQAQANAEGKDNFAAARASGFRATLLSSVGRFADALPHVVASNANKSAGSPEDLGLAKAELGQAAEARTILEPVLATYGPQVWESFVPLAFFLNAPDADSMLRSPPSSIQKPAVECLRDIRKALVSNDAPARSAGVKKVQACTEAGAVSWRVGLPALAALGDLDGAFREAGLRSFSIPAINSSETAALFYPQSRAMRADPRFLPLVEKLGMMDYWRATNSQPDVCETEAAPFCAVLKAAKINP